MAKLVSKTYGDALFEVALEKNQLDEFLDEVKAAQTAIEENKELFKLMSHPKIVKEEKIKIITDIFTGKVSEELVGLLRMIVDKGHFEQVDSVFTYFIDEVQEYRNCLCDIRNGVIRCTEGSSGKTVIRDNKVCEI